MMMMMEVVVVVSSLRNMHENVNATNRIRLKILLPTNVQCDMLIDRIQVNR
jgi:hypothetical protein